jgi:predicted transcriptional regulator of viral defense system
MKTGKKDRKFNDWDLLRKSIYLHSSIGRSDLVRLVKENVGVDVDYAIWRLKSEGVLQRPSEKKRGFFIVGRNSSNTLHIIDPIEVIHSIYGENVVFCYGTALYIHGLSRYGRLMHYYAITKSKPKKKKYSQFTIRFVKTKMGDTKGIIQHKVENHNLYTTDLERTILECIHHPKYAQGWENVIHAFETIKQIRYKQLIEYVIELNSPSLSAKVGIFLDFYKDKWKIPESEIIKLQQYIPRTTLRFERLTKGKLNKRWNIIVPHDLLQ